MFHLLNGISAFCLCGVFFLQQTDLLSIIFEHKQFLFLNQYQPQKLFLPFLIVLLLSDGLLRKWRRSGFWTVFCFLKVLWDGKTVCHKVYFLHNGHQVAAKIRVIRCSHWKESMYRVFPVNISPNLFSEKTNGKYAIHGGTECQIVPKNESVDRLKNADFLPLEIIQVTASMQQFSTIYNPRKVSNWNKKNKFIVKPIIRIYCQNVYILIT